MLSGVRAHLILEKRESTGLARGASFVGSSDAKVDAEIGVP